MRISKKPEERKKELTGIAYRLFLDMGYDNVKVSDIVKEANVAQGTFYYYFKTKEDVLYAILENMIRDMSKQLRTFTENDQIPVLIRFQTVMNKLFSPLNEDEPIFKLMQYTDSTVHNHLDELRREVIVPVIEGLVRAGVNDGTFRNLNHPTTIVYLIFDGISNLMHHMSWSPEKAEAYNEAIGGIEELFTLVLGTDIHLAESKKEGLK